MKEPIEQKLTERIRKVFDQFEDGSAEQGWEELRKKYPRKPDRKPLFLWISSAAAVLLILAGLWYFIPRNTSEEQVVNTNKIQPQTENLPKTGTPAEKNTKTVEEKSPELASRKQTPSPNKKFRSNDLPLSSRPMAQNSRKDKIEHFPDKTAIPLTVNADSVKNKTIANNASALQDTAAKAKAIPNNDNALAVNEGKAMPKEQKKVLPEIKPQPETGAVKKDKKVTFSVFAGTYFNYAEGSESNLNVGGGVLTDIPLGKKLTLSTGLAIARNTLTYNGTRRIPSNASALLDVNSPSFNNSGIRSSLVDFTANFLNLDIPVSLKYQFNPAKQRVYVTAGLGSSTYLDESYTYQYQQTNLSNGLKSLDQSKNTSRNFGEFDFARTLNVSMGLNYKVGKTQDLTIEPFLKYPLGGLGSQNIRFGSAGINLKLNFKP